MASTSTNPASVGAVPALPRHEDRIDASLQAVAFVCGESFARVRSDFAGLAPDRGIDTATLSAYLARHGLATQSVSIQDPFTQERRSPWPLRPWSDIHLVQAEDEEGPMRLVVLLRDGTVMDAYRGGPDRLDGYARVTRMVAVHYVGRSPNVATAQ